MKTLSLALTAAALSWGVQASDLDSPVGNWKNISDKTGKAEAIIQVYQEGGEIRGKLVNVFNPPEPNCTKCKGALKDKPLVGLPIMYGLKPDGSQWDGGKIIDPNDGSEYNVKIELADGGQKLKVRGYIGFSLFGRTQTWVRETAAK